MFSIDDVGSRYLVPVPPPPPPSEPVNLPGDAGTVSSQLQAQQAQLARDEQAESMAALAVKANADSVAARRALQLAQAQATLSRAEVKRLQARLDLDNLLKRAHSAANDKARASAQQELTKASEVEASSLQERNRVAAAAPAPSRPAAGDTSLLLQVDAPGAGPSTPAPFTLGAPFNSPFAPRNPLFAVPGPSTLFSRASPAPMAPPVPAPPHDVPGYQKQITAVYASQGAAAAAHLLALAETDAALDPGERKQLLESVRPVVEQISTAVGQNARETQLPAQGERGKTNGIDDQSEYKGIVADLATATASAASEADTRLVASTILGATPAMPAGARLPDNLGLLGDSLRALAPGQASLRDAVVLVLKAPQPAAAGGHSVLATAQPSRTAAANALVLSTLLSSPAIKTVNDVVKAHVKALAQAYATSAPDKLDRLDRLTNDPGFQSLDNEGEEMLALDKCDSDPAFAASVDVLTGRKDLSADEHRQVLDLMVRPGYRQDRSFVNTGANDRDKLVNNVYEASGADPFVAVDFVHVLNDGQVKAMLAMSAHLKTKDGKVDLTQDDQSYLALPADPTKVDTSAYTTITFNGQTKRYEDPVTRTFWQGGRWISDPRIDASMEGQPARNSGQPSVAFYDAGARTLAYQNGRRVVQPTSTSGWQNLLYAEGLPPLPQPAAASPAAPVASAVPAEPPAATATGALTPEQAKAAAAYTSFEMDLAHTLLVNARNLQAKLENLRPGSKDYDATSTEYTDAANLAMGERAKSQQGVEAELRGAYLGDSKNTAATQDLAHAVADRYKNDPEGQLAVRSALQTVTTETPRQRETSIALDHLHQTENALSGMKAEFDATGKTPAGFKKATDDYAKESDGVMKMLSHEFAQAGQGLPDAKARSQAVDTLGHALADRYEGDSLMLPLVVAARLVRGVSDASGTSPADTLKQQMTALGKALPAGTSLVVRQAVMNDPAIKAIVDKYVDSSAQAVTGAYNASVAAYRPVYSDSARRGSYVPPATAAMNELVSLTDPVNHPEVSPEIAARIMNKLMAPATSDDPGTLDRVVADVSYAGSHTGELCAMPGVTDGWQTLPGQGDETMRAWPMPDRQRIITELSLVADRAAAGSQPTGKGHGITWESDAVKTAVQGLASDISLRMRADPYVRTDFNGGFQAAIAGDGGVTGTYDDLATKSSYTVSYAGGVTLGLEVAHQELKFQQYDESPIGTSGLPEPDHFAKDTLQSVGAGIDQLKKNTQDLFTASHKNMAALEVTQSGYGQHMTPAQNQAGLDKIFKNAQLDAHDPNAVLGYQGALAGFVAGKKSLDQRGYEIKRVDDMVDLYGTAADTPAGWDTYVDGNYHGDDQLKGQDGFQGVVDKRNGMLSDEQVLTTVAGSDQVTTAATDMAIRASLNWGRENGVLPPASLGVIPVPLHLQWSGDTFEHVAENKFFQYTHGASMGRIGHSLPATLLSFGSVGAGQLWFTDYLYHNVSFPKGQEWRKDALLAVVGGFATIKAYQAGAVTLHGGSKVFATGVTSKTGLSLIDWLPDSMKNILDASNRVGNVEDFFKKHSEFVRTAGWKSVGAFGLLHIDAMVWDASRVWSAGKDRVDGKPLDERAFWTAFGNLNCDWATAYGEIKAAYGLLKFPTGNDPALNQAIRSGAAKPPAIAAEEAKLLYNSRMAKVGLGIAKGPGWLFDGADRVLNSALKSGLEKLGVDLGERVMLADLPGAGTIALAIWTADDFINWVGNEKQAHKLDRTVNEDFLTGAGITSDRARLLADNSLASNGLENWLSMNSLSAGLRSAYGDLGGDPNKFVDYINSISTDDLQRLRDGLRATKDAQNPLPATSQDDYWMLPRDPDDPAQRQLNPNLHYNASLNRWEDTHLKMFNAGNGHWVSTDTSRTSLSPNYWSATHQLQDYTRSDFIAPRLVQAPKSQQGIVTWLLGQGLPVPPKTSDAKALPPAPVDTTKTDEQNTYVVKPGDNLWAIAGNDPVRVQWIYDHNPWLNDRMQDDLRPINARGGQNPNYLDTGDILILPAGFEGAASRIPNNVSR